MRSWALAAVALLALGTQAQEARLGESIEVAIVNVEVHVTDKKGNRVTGLRAEDFEVRENGKLQPITNFSEFSSSVSAESVSLDGSTAVAPGSDSKRAAAAEDVRPRRSIVVFVEPLTLASFRAKEFFDALRDLLHRTVEKGDQVSIVTFVRAMRMRQPFTDDLAAVDATIDALQKEMSGVAGNRYDETRFVIDEAATAEKEFEAALEELHLSTPMAGAAVSLTALSAARRELFLVRQKTAALESLIQSISGAAGRKIVIMATRRFGLYAGAEFFDGGIPTENRQELDTNAYRTSLIRTANAHGVTIYPLHPEGITTSSQNEAWVNGNDRMESTMEQDLVRARLGDELLLNETAALNQIADATGGISAWGTASIARLLPRIGEDLQSYYSLGYRATTTGKDASRRIVVKTKNPDYVVRARTEFVEKSDVTQMKDRVRANLYQHVDGSSAKIPFDVAVGKIRKTGRNRWSVPLKIRIPIGSLTTLPQGAHDAGSFSVFFATGGVLGAMSEVEQRTQAFTIPRNDLEKAKRSHFTYDLEIAIDKLAQTMSVAVLDDVGKEFGIKRYEVPKDERK